MALKLPIYMDYHATTPVDPRVFEAMSPYFTEIFGNAASRNHEFGWQAEEAVENARKQVADLIGATSKEIVFTSGATESDNLAIKGVADMYYERGDHIITVVTEHKAVLDTCKKLEKRGFKVTYLPVASDGLISPDDVKRALTDKTILVSVMHANNETGVIQPLEGMAEVVRSSRANGQELFFHSDGVQAIGKIEVDLGRLGVDLYSISAHKIFAPKGVGGLFVRNGVPVRGLQLGGRHERERRAGTENVPGAMAFARAIELCRAEDYNALASLRDSFESDLIETLPNIEVNGAAGRRLPNTSNVLFHGASAQNLAIALDMKGIAVSTGAACSSGSLEPSPVLLAMGLSREEARSSVRFSLGRYQTREDVIALRAAIVDCMARLRNPKRTERSVVV